jgi:hypothetical protein
MTPLSPAILDIKSITRFNNLATIELHGPVSWLEAGDRILVSGLTDPSFNGSYTIESALPSGWFTFRQIGHDGAFYSCGRVTRTNFPAVEKSPGSKIQLKPEDKDYVTIYAFLHSIDPTIIGYKILALEDTTQEWVAVVEYANGEYGTVKGKGTHVTEMKGGSAFDIIDKSELARRIEAEPDAELDRWLEPREV